MPCAWARCCGRKPISTTCPRRASPTPSRPSSRSGFADQPAALQDVAIDEGRDFDLVVFRSARPRRPDCRRGTSPALRRHAVGERMRVVDLHPQRRSRAPELLRRWPATTLRTGSPNARSRDAGLRHVTSVRPSRRTPSAPRLLRRRSRFDILAGWTHARSPPPRPPTAATAASTASTAAARAAALRALAGHHARVSCGRMITSYFAPVCRP